MEFLRGKKTYAVGIAAILSAGAAYFLQQIELADLLQAVATALIGMCLRAGIAKS